MLKILQKWAIISRSNKSPEGLPVIKLKNYIKDLRNQGYDIYKK